MVLSMVQKRVSWEKLWFEHKITYLLQPQLAKVVKFVKWRSICVVCHSLSWYFCLQNKVCLVLADAWDSWPRCLYIMGKQQHNPSTIREGEDAIGCQCNQNLRFFASENYYSEDGGLLNSLHPRKTFCFALTKFFTVSCRIHTKSTTTWNITHSFQTSTMSTRIRTHSMPPILHHWISWCFFGSLMTQLVSLVWEWAYFVLPIGLHKADHLWVTAEYCVGDPGSLHVSLHNSCASCLCVWDFLGFSTWIYC